jgi:hypothetical protein
VRAKPAITEAGQATETRPTFGDLIASLIKGLALGVIAGLVLAFALGAIPLPWSTSSATGLTFIFAQNSTANSDD